MERNQQLIVRLSAEEQRVVRTLAAAHDRSVSSYVRSLIRQAANKAGVPAQEKQYETHASR